MKTLAEFVRTKREALGLTPTGLSHRCGVKTEMIEEIESGKELFLPVTIRQNLAKGLKVSPKEIKLLEKDFTTDLVPQKIIAELKEQILSGNEDLLCPRCGAKLVTRIAKMYDLEDNLMLHPKAHCQKCVFQIV